MQFISTGKLIPLPRNSTLFLTNNRVILETRIQQIHSFIEWFPTLILWTDINISGVDEEYLMCVEMYHCKRWSDE